MRSLAIIVVLVCLSLAFLSGAGDDWCMNHFTPLQDERMVAVVEEYRPTLAAH